MQACEYTAMLTIYWFTIVLKYSRLKYNSVSATVCYFLITSEYLLQADGRLLVTNYLLFVIELMPDIALRRYALCICFVQFDFAIVLVCE